MTEVYLMKCNFGINHGKFLYKCLSNSGLPVWATSIDSAMEFRVREVLELFAVEKDIASYDILTVVKHESATNES